MDCQWKPVPVPQLEGAYEFRSDGAVRSARGEWMRPEMSCGVPVYKLPHSGSVIDVPAKALFASSGKGVSDREWVERFACLADAANERMKHRRYVRELMQKAHAENEEGALDKLADMWIAGCPWCAGRVEGGAASADPVLGF